MKMPSQVRKNMLYGEVDRSFSAGPKCSGLVVCMCDSHTQILSNQLLFVDLYCSNLIFIC